MNFIAANERPPWKSPRGKKCSCDETGHGTAVNGVFYDIDSMPEGSLEMSTSLRIHALEPRAVVKSPELSERPCAHNSIYGELAHSTSRSRASRHFVAGFAFRFSRFAQLWESHAGVYELHNDPERQPHSCSSTFPDPPKAIFRPGEPRNTRETSSPVAHNRAALPRAHFTISQRVVFPFFFSTLRCASPHVTIANDRPQ